MQPRPYQQSFIESVEKGWSEFRKQLGVAPTGGGKTIIFSHLADRLLKSTGGKTLILAHREELIDQAIAKLNAATGIMAQKEKAEFSASLTSPVVVASVQSMVRRLDKWPADHFKLVVMDEAHHSLAGQFRAVLDHFTGANILGVTATPDRGDKRSLGEFYENIASEIKLLDLIKDGFLAPITIQTVPLKIDLNTVSQTQGDFDKKELGNILEPFLDQIARAIKHHARDRKTLCFLPLIATSMKFVESCERVGINARHVDGESPNRGDILDDFAANKFQLLSNAMLLTEGYDCPDISCIVVLRPTRSRPLFAQMVGRGTRTAPNKKNLLILDFLWLHERHNIVHPASLIAKDEEEAQAITDLAEERGMASDEEQDLLGLADDVAADREEKLREKIKKLANRKAKFITAEEFAVKYSNMDIATFEPTMKWEAEPVTAKQREWIEKFGVDADTLSGKGQASKVLDVVFKEMGKEPATSGQKWVMRKAGWVSKDGLRDAGKATRAEAREFFAAQNKTKKATT